MSGVRHRPLLFWASLVAALLLALAPLPMLLQPFKPYWPALIMLYWIMEAPETMGLGLAFLFGLVADLLFGTLFGEQALRLAIIAFLGIRFRARIRFFPMWQQGLAVFAMLLNDRIVVLGIRLFAGDGWPPAAFWVGPLTGMVLWPWLFLLMDSLSQWRRGRR